MAGTFPARIHVLLARDSPRALVIRRGPAKQVCTILWDRANDTFELGQWLAGRIYERRADISPDGKYWIYFALNGKWDSETRGSWTAVARVPYLKALVLYAKGDAWGGGGLFTGPNSYWLNDGIVSAHDATSASSAVTLDKDWNPAVSYGGECPGVYYHRLQRDGWRLTDELEKHASGHTFVFEKPLARQWILRKYAHAGPSDQPGRGCYWDEHELENASTRMVLAQPDWEWAEWDHGRVVYARTGQLWGTKLIDRERFQEPQLLHDFTDMSFEAIEAPY